MSNVASHVAAFYRDVRRHGRVFAVRDAAGFPVPVAAGGGRSMPFWSTRSRAERVILSVPAFATMYPEELSLTLFVERWLPGLQRDGLLVGLNWTAPQAAGWEFAPTDVLARLAAEIAGFEFRTPQG
jgi:hypothetical protein